MDFPDTGIAGMKYDALKPQLHQFFENHARMFDAIRKKDVLVHHPYQSFDYVLRLMREAAIDPDVQSIHITLYRMARISQVANNLITAAINGKKVTAIVEIKARFDEETNMYWAEKMQEAGVKVIFGFHHLKVHCKMCLIARKENDEIVRYAHLSTGNYNGQTAKIYSDEGLFTCDDRLVTDVKNLFSWLESSVKHYTFNHLLVAPNFLREQLEALIRKEIKNAKAGLPAWLKFKMNSLTDENMIALLYEASCAGVRIQLVVRGMCCLVPGKKGMSEKITVVSILDRFLEHSRIYAFANGGKEKVYLASADMMNRNLSNRVEIAFPIYDKALRQEMMDILEIQLSDNCKARIIDSGFKNQFVPRKPGEIKNRAQWSIYQYLGKANKTNTSTPPTSPRS
jgi:polyphosphate kinase